jgi:ribosomal protein S18 acetylase RimI-like enzyme
MSEITITTPAASQAEEMTKMIRATWLATYPNESIGITIDDINIFTQALLSKEKIAFLARNLDERTAEAGTYQRVAMKQGKIVGEIYGKENEDFVQLHSLYVLPEEQGQGIGRMLMKEFLEWANHDKRIQLLVAEYNLQAIRFYESQGFVDTGKRFTEERFRFKSGSILPLMEMVFKGG